ncbi:LacI family DNA-binding transcriptional regulator, partial [Klebsiella pneumoniae]
MIPHGTYSGYKHHRCRCAPCNQACRDYVNHRSRMVAYGRWEPWGDLDQVRAHLRWLQKRGVSLVRVAELAGVGVSTVSYVANRAVRVRRGVAEKILSVTCDPVPAGTRVSAVGTIRRV